MALPSGRSIVGSFVGRTENGAEMPEKRACLGGGSGIQAPLSQSVQSTVGIKIGHYARQPPFLRPGPSGTFQETRTELIAFSLQARYMRRAADEMRETTVATIQGAAATKDAADEALKHSHKVERAYSRAEESVHEIFSIFPQMVLQELAKPASSNFTSITMGKRRGPSTSSHMASVMRRQVSRQFRPTPSNTGITRSILDGAESPLLGIVFQRNTKFPSSTVDFITRPSSAPAIPRGSFIGFCQTLLPNP